MWWVNVCIPHRMQQKLERVFNYGIAFMCCGNVHNPLQDDFGATTGHFFDAIYKGPVNWS